MFGLFCEKAKTPPSMTILYNYIRLCTVLTSYQSMVRSCFSFFYSLHKEKFNYHILNLKRLWGLLDREM